MSNDLSVHIQIAGSLLILIPFVLVQMKRLRPEARLYVWLNFVGSAVLALDAWHGHQWGFLLLEGTWAAVSLVALLRQARLPLTESRLESPCPSTRP